MKSYVNRYNKMVSMCILISILLCSFFCLNYDFDTDRNTNAPVTHGSYGLQASGLFEIINAEEISVSASQAVLIRQFSSRKGNSWLIGTHIMEIMSAPVIFLALLAFLNLCTEHLKESHRFIMDFIHKKDGQKA